MTEKTAPATTAEIANGGNHGVAYEAIVVSQTHWDRDWYATFEQFRHRLVYVIDRLLDLLESRPDFKTFTFDGQACIVDDYLRIRPENRERFEKRSREGRILLGPWFCLPDEYLVSGEAMIRNLLTGRRVGLRHGKLSRAGYCPDAFGHVSQLPQILAGFGLTSALFTRGFGDEMDRLGLTFEWLSSDSEIGVLGVNLIGGYGNSSALGYDARHVDLAHAQMSLETAESYVKEILDRMGPMTKTRSLLFCNGVDHMEAQFDLPDVIEHINASDLPITLHHGTFSEFIDAIRAENADLETYQGEFHLGRDQVILTGTISSRIYLKQANARTQSMLEGQAEPITALSHLLMGGEDFRAFLHEAWRLTLLNHPHDDICGCSIDQVHREMVPRFAKAQQIAELGSWRGLVALAGLCDASRPGAMGYVAVHNPSAWKRGGVAEFTFTALQSETSRDTDLRIVTADGSPVPAEFTFDRAEFAHTFEHFDPVHRAVPVNRWRVKIAASALPPMGIEVFAIEMGKAPAEKPSVKATDTSLENEHLRVTVRPNGTLDIEDLQTGVKQEGVLLFEDVADVGDEYDYSWPEDSAPVDTSKCKAESKLLKANLRSATLGIHIPWTLPAQIDDKRARRVKETVDNSLDLTITLREGARVIEVEAAWINQAKDHRLRAVFPTTIKARCTSAETKFDVIDRALEPPVPKTKWEQDPLNFHPMDRFVSISDGKAGFALLSEGLHEYEATATDAGTKLELTVLRCVGWLALPGLVSRPVGAAGPVIETPEAQCIGPQRVRFAIAPHSGDWREGAVMRRAQEFNVSLAATQVVEPKGQLPASIGFLRAKSDDLHITTFKESEHREAFVVHILNMGPETIASELATGFELAEAWLTNLAEDRQEKIALADSSVVPITVRPRQILAVELTPKR